MTTRRISENEIVLGEDDTKKRFSQRWCNKNIYTEQYSDDFKRDAYFYYDILYRTTEYIKFIEESFEPTDCVKSIKN